MNTDSNEVRERTLQISGGKAFQALGHEKILKITFGHYRVRKNV